MAQFRNILLGLLVSTLGGSVCAWLKTPFPWMIGPIVAMAIFNFGVVILDSVPQSMDDGAWRALRLSLYQV